ncbi:MAG: molybdenum cofactor biosynthesis protein MoaE [Terriglobales bacterium]|jgi:molybdopterin synthase catalytic subunit
MDGRGVVCRHFAGAFPDVVTILMQIRVLLFGILKDAVRRPSEVVELPDGARVGDVLARYRGRFPEIAGVMSTVAVSVNQEYSRPERILEPGDEVGLLPPVSGGAADVEASDADSARGEVLIVKEPISTSAVLSRLKRPQDGAAVVFEGVVRDNTRGRRTLFLEYEAYGPMALKQMEGLRQQAGARFGVEGISIIHRLGRLEIGETSVLVVVASAHRAAAFDACRWIIDTLKKTVPIWKKEHFEDGAVWADGEPFPEEIRRP